MQAFEYKKDDQIIGIVHYPNTGDIIVNNNLTLLATIIKKTFTNYNSKYHNLTDEEKNLIETMTINNDSFNFASTANEKQLFNIVNFFQKNYGEKIIVPQSMGSGPIIRHRPLYFEENNNCIIVKYTTFGDFNNFTTALQVLNN